MIDASKKLSIKTSEDALIHRLRYNDDFVAESIEDFQNYLISVLKSTVPKSLTLQTNLHKESDKKFVTVSCVLQYPGSWVKCSQDLNDMNCHFTSMGFQWTSRIMKSDSEWYKEINFKINEYFYLTLNEKLNICYDKIVITANRLTKKEISTGDFV